MAVVSDVPGDDEVVFGILGFDELEHVVRLLVVLPASMKMQITQMDEFHVTLLFISSRFPPKGWLRPSVSTAIPWVGSSAAESWSA
jgi:hypothetical protein